MKQILTKTAILPLLILTIFASIFLGWKFKSDLHQLQIGFIDEHKAETEKQSKEIQSKLNFLYQSIRTMSFIPSVRKVNRHGENLDDDAKATLQQLFNNAYQDIQMSEIYVIPSSLDPDKIDPVTKKNEEPIITFDEFITTDAPKKAEEEKKPELEEVEYFEYVQMKKQLEYFAQNYSTRDKIKDLEVPMLASEIVITCDNAEFSKADLEAKNDEPRKGIVFTVPVYDFNGKLHGGVSAVLRTNILRSYLDAHMASAIVNMENHITIGKKNDSTEWLSALPYFKKSETNPNLIFSSIQKINFGEKSDWQIWYAQNDEEFWILPEVKAAKTQFWILQIVVWGLFAAATAFMIRKWRLSLRVERIVDNLTNSVEGLASASKQVSETSIELQSSASQQNKAIDSVASAINQINSTIEKTADLGRQLQEQAQNSQNASQNGQQAVQDMVAINNQLAEAFTEIIKQIEQNKNHFFDMQKMFETIKTKTKVIDEIVFQTRLLSFNASVEAARAGEFGKGFAVVAEEIGNLAKMSGDSAHEIAEVITEGTSQVEVLVAETTKSVDVMTEQFNQQIHQSKSASESGHQALEALVQQVAQFFEMAVQLSQATNEQSSGVNEILNSIQNVNAMSDKNSTISDESTQVANHLKAQAETISSQIKYLQKLMSAKVQERSDKPDDELAS